MDEAGESSRRTQRKLDPGRVLESELNSPVWVGRPHSPEAEPATPNTIEVWIYDAREPERQLTNYRTTLRVSRERLLDDSGHAAIEIAVSGTLGVEVGFGR